MEDKLDRIIELLEQLVDKKTIKEVEKEESKYMTKDELIKRNH